MGEKTKRSAPGRKRVFGIPEARKFCRYTLENFIYIEKTVIFERYNFKTDYV